MKIKIIKRFILFYISPLTIWLLMGSCSSSLPAEVEIAYESLPAQLDFNFHIKPLLVDRCYQCHGPDDNTREAGFRLDQEAAAFAPLKESGGRAFVKGSLGNSVAWQRIISTNPDLQMPPPSSHLSLSPYEKALLVRWIKEGAEWKEHWAFIPPQQQELPAVESESTANFIDYFILAKLQENGLSPAPPAEKERLIRRLTMDLTGLPPSIPEIDAFLADNTPTAYEKLVDRLLQTDAHAERMAMEWLDVARFGDTQGLHLDAERYNWPWRDWVIKAFKENIRYDDFITWQIAGDLLPNASREQKLATAFNRHHPTSAEGGIVDEEYRQKYVQDRTNTVATAFLGLTMECATCHDHKFDPISQKEYYQMSAFFNNIKEIGLVSEFRVSKEGKGPVYAAGPVLLLPEPAAEVTMDSLSESIEIIRKQQAKIATDLAATKVYLEALEEQTVKAPIATASFSFESVQPHAMKYGVVHRIQNNIPIDKMVDGNPNAVACGNPEVVKGKLGNALRSPKEIDLVFLKDVGSFELHEAFSAGAWMHTEKENENQTLMGNGGETGNAWRGWDLFLDTLSRPSIKLTSIWPHNYMQITADISIPKEEWHHLFFTYDGSAKADGLQLYVDGKKVNTVTNYDHLYGTIIRDFARGEEWKSRPLMVFRSGRFYSGENGVFKGSIDEVKLFDQWLSPLEVAAIVQAEAPDLKLAASTNEDYLDHYLNRQNLTYQNLQGNLQSLLAQKLAVMKGVPEIMVMQEMPTPRKTFVLSRGQYDAPAEEVFAATPEQVLSFPKELARNRLGLSKWLVDEKNPLTARVAVNRYWQMVFGQGIVDTPHDFGTQGALPSHPALLDQLALHFVSRGWNVRDLLKTMVLSSTYRQSSVATASALEKDPKNIFLARGPSYRLQAEMIRDNALAASGLLTQKVGGPSVKPYQPAGIWDFGGLVSGRYQADSEEDLYRRSMYTYIRRTSPHPAMVAFDGPNRLVCTVKRENTNTPLQALVLLNDPQFVEAARVLAQRMQEEGGSEWESQAQYGFRLLCGRKAKESEMALMKKQYEFALKKYQDNPIEAADLLAVGEYPFDPGLDKIQTAALAMVASTMMNFDEAYMKR